jgi:hypothetical protein
MDDHARDALESSIEHWYRISACTTNDELMNEGYEADSCPLCLVYAPPDKYFETPHSDRCNGCPVKTHTGIWGCRKTPYKSAAISLDSWAISGVWLDVDQDNVEAEIRFLESLL